MTILLVCAAGMSTSLLVEAMRKAAGAAAATSYPADGGMPLGGSAAGGQVHIEAVGSEGLEDRLGESDVILVAPQVRHRFARFAELAAAAGRPIGLIDPKVYGLVDGAGALAQARALAAGDAPHV